MLDPRRWHGLVPIGGPFYVNEHGVVWREIGDTAVMDLSDEGKEAAREWVSRLRPRGDDR